MPKASVDLKCSQVRFLLGVHENGIACQSREKGKGVEKESRDIVSFLHFPELKASIMSKPRLKTQQTSKGSLFTWAEGQSDCFISPFDHDRDSCHRMKVVDHRVPSYVELTATSTKTNTILLEIGDDGAHGHHWKLKNLLTQSLRLSWSIRMLKLWRMQTYSWLWCFSYNKNHLAIVSFFYFKIMWLLEENIPTFFFHAYIYFWKAYTVYWQDVCHGCHIVVCRNVSSV